MEPRPRTLAETQLLADASALRALAQSLLGGDDADDVVQSAYAAALATPAAVRRPGLWLRGTVRNLANLCHRREARRRTHERARPLPEPPRDPIALATQAELVRDVGAAVHALDEPFRAVVMLRFWHGMRPDAIAAELGVPRNTVRSRLQRGLARLRAQLDARHGDRERWTAPLGAFAGVRQAATGFVAAGTWLAAGVIMKTKLLLAAAALLVAALAIPWSMAGETAPRPAASAATGAPATTLASVEEPEREATALAADKAASSAGQPVEPFDRTPVRVAPWLARFRAIDDDDRPVVEATIAIWAGPHVPDGTSLQKVEPSVVTVSTDVDGRATATLDYALVAAAASKAGIGRTGDTWLEAERNAGDETVFVLQVPILQRGTVLRVDGSPAVGATVRMNVQGSSTLQRGEPAVPEPVTTDSEGRFAVPLQRYAIYAIHAELGGTRTFRDALTVYTDKPRDLLLTFPGAITLGGLVVDPDGSPVAEAEVFYWREYHLDDPAQDADDFETSYVKTAADGRFAIEVRQFRRYQLLARAPGHASSELLWVETTAVRPHLQVRLGLQRATTIRGVVLRSDGSPLVGSVVSADPEAGTPTRATAVPSREVRFGRTEWDSTDAQGHFTLSVHPSTTWRLRVQPLRASGLLCYLRSGVPPGSEGVEIRIGDAELAGCVVQGTVVRADDQQPVTAFEVDLLRS